MLLYYKMPSCDTCGKEFTTHSGLQKHKTKKIPCKPPTHLIETAIHRTLEQAGALHLEVPTSDFRDASKQFHTTLSKRERMDQGIFFTPKKVRDLLFSTITRFDIKPTSILEPSFGSGEFLLDARRLYPDAKLYGVEKNPILFQSVMCKDSVLTCCDFLDWVGSADLIIGNPPYFVIPSDKALVKKYANCMTGRPNIYILFLYKCLTEHLNPDGVLAFIIPTSLYNCSYYQPMRNYIKEYTTILHMETLVKPGFFETAQDTMLIIIKNKKIHDDYIFVSKTDSIYLSPFYKELRETSPHTTTLYELGFGVKTGNVVWNQVKDKLTDDNQHTLLIYSHNISSGELVINNLCGEERKQYVTLDKPTLSGPVILVERGYGNTFHFNFAVVDMPVFYAENHINVIYPKTKDAEKHFGSIVKSFKDPRHMNFIRWFIGNGSMPATDLEKVIPIFSDVQHDN